MVHGSSVELKILLEVVRRGGIDLYEIIHMRS